MGLPTAPRAAHRRGEGRGRPSSRAVAVLLALALASVLAACSVPGVYVVEKPGENLGRQTFSAPKFVDSIWAAKVVPAFTANQNDAGAVLKLLAADRSGAEKKYGRQSASGGSASFVVSGTGTVVSGDTGSAVGRLEISVPGVPRKVSVYLAVGPAFVGTAVRDTLPFIDFSQFTNQLDYADVGTALNEKVKTTVVTALPAKPAKGTVVSFSGAFTVLDPTAIVITPVVLKVGP